MNSGHPRSRRWVRLAASKSRFKRNEVVEKWNQCLATVRPTRVYPILEAFDPVAHRCGE